MKINKWTVQRQHFQYQTHDFYFLLFYFILLKNMKQTEVELYMHLLYWGLIKYFFSFIFLFFVCSDLGNSNLSGPLVADLGRLEHLQYLWVLLVILFSRVFWKHIPFKYFTIKYTTAKTDTTWLNYIAQ